jgi:hypothetical protein
MRHTGVKSTFDADIDESAGKVVAVLSTETESAGGGSVASIQFEVIDAQRPAEISVSTIAATSANNARLTVASPPPLSIAVQAKP